MKKLFNSQTTSTATLDLDRLEVVLATLQKPSHVVLAERSLKAARQTLAELNAAHRERCIELRNHPGGSPVRDDRLDALGEKLDAANAAVGRARRELEIARASFAPTFLAAIEEFRLAAAHKLIEAAASLEDATDLLRVMRVYAEKNGIDLPNSRADLSPVPLRALAHRLGAE
jgi:hypothetical protein